MSCVVTDPSEARCRPLTVSYFNIENQLAVGGITADIRSFGWRGSFRSQFQADYYYLDYSFDSRVEGSRLMFSDRSFTPPPGDIAFIPRGFLMNAECKPCHQRLLCLTIDHDKVDAFFEDDRVLRGVEPCFDVQVPDARQMMARIAREVREPGLGSDILVESWVMMLIVEIGRMAQNAPRQGMTTSGKIAEWRLNRIKDRVRHGLGNTLSINDLASECGMSPRHLARAFKATLGMTLSEYIANERMRHAESELRNKDLPIKIVAHNCGFKNAAAFASAFRRTTGMSPREYRLHHFQYTH